MLALQFGLLLGLQPFFLLALAVDHAVDAHTLIPVRALACSETHYYNMPFWKG
jgi:hypothetical protein